MHSDVIVFTSLDEGRSLLGNIEENKQVIIANKPGSAKFLGILLIDKIFKILKYEFKDKIINYIINSDEDLPTVFSAIKLGYKNINYTGKSISIYNLLKSL